MTTKEFQDVVWEYYRQYGRRHLPWREDSSPYNVLVSEIMLQQTQVERVIPKFLAFVKQFPTAEALAKASLADVLKAWQGLGYNRRAKYLHEAAKEIVRLGVFPETQDALRQLPGVGANTAGAIVVYAFDHVCFFVETNIRTVYFHHFFPNKVGVSDTELLQVVSRTFDRSSPRRWCSALMDYGSYLKKQGHGKNAVSKHYVKQSRFEGSERQLRGLVVRELARGPKTYEALSVASGRDGRLEAVLKKLAREKLIGRKLTRYHLLR